MLALTNISLRRGRKVLFENASFQIHAGQRMGVIGANGSGKSSLFAMVLGELEPDDGEFALFWSTSRLCCQQMPGIISVRII